VQRRDGSFCRQGAALRYGSSSPKIMRPREHPLDRREFLKVPPKTAGSSPFMSTTGKCSPMHATVSRSASLSNEAAVLNSRPGTPSPRMRQSCITRRCSGRRTNSWSRIPDRQRLRD
jgi:hypothetical protein